MDEALMLLNRSLSFDHHKGHGIDERLNTLHWLKWMEWDRLNHLDKNIECLEDRVH